MTLSLHPTSLGQWQALLNEAQLAAAITLQEELESYLAFMLMRFCQRPEFTQNPIGLEFLLALDDLSTLQDQKLQEVGDTCLLFSGLFPENAYKRRVSMNYYIELGQTAYNLLSNKYHQPKNKPSAQLYSSLCGQFVSMRDVLDAMRDTDANRNNDMLLYFYLWDKFKSTYALKKLQLCSEIFSSPSVNIIKKLH
jgi:hypothetical protein